MTITLPAGFTSLRYEQHMAIGQALSHFSNGVEVVAIDAPPGVGKTLIGEVVRMEMDTRGIYLCDSKSLQDQFAGDFPYATILKGRSNYPTELYPERHRDRWDPLSAADCTWRKDQPDCKWCEAKASCPYEMVKREALMSAKVVNTNTSYFLTESNYVGNLSAGFGLITLDEATLLERALLNHIEITLTQAQMRALGVGWPSKKTVESAWIEWFQKTIELLQRREDAIIGFTVDDDKQRQKLKRLRERMMYAMLGVQQGGWVYDGYDQGYISFEPIDIAPFGPDLFWRHGKQFLCMDGSFGNAKLWLDEVGASGMRTAVVECDSPFDPENRQVRFTPMTDMTWEGRAECWPEMAKGIHAIMMQHPNERILVHTVSYLFNNWVYQTLNDPRVMTYTDSFDKSLVIENFENTPGAVLLAPSMERGYDGSDDKVRVVVVAKMPYPSKGSKRVEKMLYARGWAGENWYAQQTARAIMQMTGRGTRHENDWSISYILDGQFSKFWKDHSDKLANWWKKSVKWNGPWRGEVEKLAGL